ncbi:sugar phosphate isomerase/epimerase family protein [Actinophytocola glycyrrhizae]|uniref:Sugar phosphate isomerase/epimerase family protein n=1 Tax=Actinophytocola glycyrrhizae TaxID=2044873 RepID=A0ABV9S509_9PSEU
MIPGLVSVTFRQLSPAEIVSLVVDAGLEAIEWGGDVHVPAGDFRTARDVRARCADNGIAIEAYGSYYRADGDFGPVLATALALGAPRIRVWAGTKGSAGQPDRAAVVEDLRAVAALAGGEGVEVAVEYHADTLTDTLDSALALFEEVPALKSYWQPPVGATVDDALAAVPALDPVAVHVFSWTDDGTRLPLAAREPLWRPVLAALPADRHALLEFVRADSPTTFLQDATTLHTWLKTPPQEATT